MTSFPPKKTVHCGNVAVATETAFSLVKFNVYISKGKTAFSKQRPLRHFLAEVNNRCLEDFLEGQATTLVDLSIAIVQHLNSVMANNQKALKKLPKRDIAKIFDIIQMNF